MIEAPTVDEYGAETHPAFGMISVSRGSVSPPGAVLFDSELRHGNILTVHLAEGRRNRNLNHDWLSRGREIVEFDFSEAQWATFVSAIGTGGGVPCTIRRVGLESTPDLPYEPRLKQSVDEAETAADRAYDKVREAFAAVKDKPTKTNLRALELALDAVGPNVRFAAESLVRHVENTVTKARADIEATVARHAEVLGVEADGYTAPLALEGS